MSEFKQHVKQVQMGNDRQSLTIYQSAWSDLDRNRFLATVLHEIPMHVEVDATTYQNSKHESSAATNGFVSNSVTLMFKEYGHAREVQKKMTDLLWAA